MRKVRILGPCLVVAFALSAVAATSASAFVEEAPEYGRCLKLTGGKWKDAACKTAGLPGEEKYEWYPAFGPNGKGEEKLATKLKFTSTTKEETRVELETTKEERIVCTGTNGKGKEARTSEGEVTGPKTNIATKIVLRGCEIPEFAVCENTGTAGEIKMNDLDGTLGFQTTTGEQSKWKVANLYKPKTGSIFTEFTCIGVPWVVKSNSESLGGLMNPITANAMRLSETVILTATKGKQKPEKFAADPTGTKRVLLSNKLGGAFVQTGLTLTTVSTNEEQIEVSTLN
jgi:hypothetical protein